MLLPFPIERPSRRILAIALLAVVASLLVASSSSARSFAPRHDRIYHGVSDTSEVADFASFRRQVRAHPAVLQEMYHWDVSLKASLAFKRWRQTDTLGVVSMSTKFPATGRVEMSPGQIAGGKGDDYLLRLNEQLAGFWGRPVLFRLFPEMNGSWNPYSAFDADGSPRDSAHSTRQFKRAWRRFVIIVRGGARKKVNHRLRQNDMPRILNAKSNHDRIYARRGVPKLMPKPKVGFMWVPQTTGSPNVPGNQPKSYWPGGNFVDWVGIDIYSKYASAAMPKMREFYSRWKGYPFVIGEYAPWDDDQGGAWTRQLLGWARSHDRVGMLIYYRSVTPDNPFNINFYPGARSALRSALNRPKFDPYAPSAR